MSHPIADRIITLREDRGWSQGQLAAYARVEQTWLSNVEVGRTRNPNPEYLTRVARALGTTVEYLVTGREPSVEDPDKAPVLRRLAEYTTDQLLRAERMLRIWLSEPIPPEEETKRQGRQIARENDGRNQAVPEPEGPSSR